jgi:hypothetical protein
MNILFEIIQNEVDYLIIYFNQINDINMKYEHFLSKKTIH